MNAAQHILVLGLRLYRWVVSPAKVFLFGPLGRCRFEPSCSAYALEAVRAHGALVGSWLGLRRICRCHPWGGCGADPVPPRHKSEGRNPNAERNPKSEIPNRPLGGERSARRKPDCSLKAEIRIPKVESPTVASRFRPRISSLHWRSDSALPMCSAVRASDFGFRSSFGSRPSDLGFGHRARRAPPF